MEDDDEEGPGRFCHEELDDGPGGGVLADEDEEGPGRLEGSGSG